MILAALRKLLPYRQKLIHVRWAGEGCWIPLGEFKLGVDFENHTSHPSIGRHPVLPRWLVNCWIILAYGSCCFASKMGQLAGNHFLTIVEGKENLRALGTKVLWGRGAGCEFSADVRRAMRARAALARRARSGMFSVPGLPHAGAFTRNHAAYSAGRNSSVNAVAITSPPMIAAAIGPQNTRARRRDRVPAPPPPRSG
ncbi:DUF3830 family protein [Cupriavidus basilensis]